MFVHVASREGDLLLTRRCSQLLTLGTLMVYVRKGPPRPLWNALLAREFRPSALGTMGALLAHLDLRTCARARHRTSASTQDFVQNPSSWASHRLRPRQSLLWQAGGQVRAQAPKCRPGSSLLGRPKDPERNLAEPTMLACGLRFAGPPSSSGPASTTWNSFGFQTSVAGSSRCAQAQGGEDVVDFTSEHVR